MPLPTAHVPATVVKVNPEGKFRELFNSSIQRVHASNGTAQRRQLDRPVQADESNPTAPATTELAAPVNKRDVSVIAAHDGATEVDATANGMLGLTNIVPADIQGNGPKALRVALPPAPSLVTPKKQLTEDAAERAIANKNTPEEGTASVTPQPVIATLAPAPAPAAPIAPASTTDGTSVKAVPSANASKGSKGRGLASARQISGQDAKRVDAGAAPGSVDKTKGVTSQAAAMTLSPPLVHEEGHVDIVAAPGVLSAVSMDVPHRSTTPGLNLIATASDVRLAQPLSEGSSQASDLKTLVATPNVLEVGIASGSHGWLRVRAELGQAGEVAASVVAASAGAAQGLHKELPALSAYLTAERVGVNSLIVNAAEKGVGAQDSALNNGAGGSSGSHSGDDQREKYLPSSPTQRSGTSSDRSGVDRDRLLAFAETSVPRIIRPDGSGSWVSVRV